MTHEFIEAHGVTFLLVGPADSEWVEMTWTIGGTREDTLQRRDDGGFLPVSRYTDWDMMARLICL
jgi:hypothetical protein